MVSSTSKRIASGPGSLFAKCGDDRRIERVGPEQIVPGLRAGLEVECCARVGEVPDVVCVARVVDPEEREREVAGEPFAIDGRLLPRTHRREQDRIPRRLVQRLAVVVPHGLEQAQHARGLAFGRRSGRCCLARRSTLGKISFQLSAPGATICSKPAFAMREMYGMNVLSAP